MGKGMVRMMVQDGINGFCMALADSVPGVSGGTVAFLMGFYDRLIGAIHDLAFGKMEEKKKAALYLARLGLGWVMGMALAAFVLSALFEKQIYVVSSLFLGLVVGAVPLIVKEEFDSLREIRKGGLFGLLGLAAVAGVTAANGSLGAASMDLGQFSTLTAVKLFFIGMIAISAMFLPGISGSTLLLIFGAYLPVIGTIKGVLSMEFSYLPSLMFFGGGVLIGSVTVVKAIRECLQRFRPQTVWLILGMMVGSLYAIEMGPTTLEMPKDPLQIGNFHPLAAAVGILLTFGMQKLRERQEKRDRKEELTG